MQMTDLFDVIVCGDMCAERKPDPECYLKAMGLLGAVPQECLVFEDSSVGIHAAKQAGIEVAAFTGSGNGQDVSEADYVVSEYDDTSELFDFCWILSARILIRAFHFLHKTIKIALFLTREINVYIVQ